ncbi:MAG: XTP/dITP diphosphatase [Candidatus Desulfofervidaceae bacterium]|nr:XTP/dITP diphosphatase [Candidatus Desulfofervidaceae bacterium]MDL1970833.1 XTP/dITP diphosphatase [Candidatus Desulfofervidaceae bacterium]
MKLVLATKNKGKIVEIVEIIADLPQIEVLSIADFPELPPIEETGKNFKENAILKAKTVARFTGHWTLADDSGLTVAYLNGAPGIYSARYAGENATDEENNAKLLAVLKDVPMEKRQAAFVCVMALCSPGGECYTCEGRCEGLIALAPKGSHGFGYDPLFYVPAYGKTMAELGPEVKNKISHRAAALKQLKPLLQKVLKQNRTGI